MHIFMEFFLDIICTLYLFERLGVLILIKTLNCSISGRFSENIRKFRVRKSHVRKIFMFERVMLRESHQFNSEKEEILIFLQNI